MGGAPVGGGPGPGGVAGSAGSPSTTLRAQDFDRSCVFDHDCTLVTEGDPCGCLGCSNAAIASRELPKWDAERSAIVCTNPAGPCPLPRCIGMLAACGAGTCHIRAPRIIDATQFDQSCQTDADCVVVYTGEVCSVCRCGAGAINKNALPAYEKEVAAEQCNPGPSPCDCAAPGVSHCAVSAPGSGICVLG
jgi:hypothetical protein